MWTYKCLLFKQYKRLNKLFLKENVLNLFQTLLFDKTILPWIIIRLNNYM